MLPGMRRRAAAVQVAVAALAALTACGCRAEWTGEYCGTLVIAGLGEPDILLPPASDDAHADAVDDQVYVKLADLGPSGNTFGDVGFVPELAERWEWDNPRTITFHLNPNARWHDGRPVRAEDVAFSFDVNTDSIVNSRARASLTKVRRAPTRDSLPGVGHFSEGYPEQFYVGVHQMPSLSSRRLRT